MKDRKFLKTLFTCIFVVTACIIVSCINFIEQDKINYKNADATWHVLLTMNAYDETPYSIHKFLPIVTLGRKSDKNISWGATVADKYGNYYYTSFSALGFITPYLFLKTFHFQYNENSLYVFNSFLLSLSSIILVFFILSVFHNSKNKYLLAFLGVLLYLSNLEIQHNYGHVYWHHSLSQVVLLIQIFAFYKFNSSNYAKIIFYIACLINPFIECTGFIANIGFIAAQYFYCKKKINKSFLIFALSTFVLTAISGILFCLHYLLNIPFLEFLKASFLRANARSSISLINILKLIRTYFMDAGFLFAFLFISFVYINLRKIDIKENAVVLLNTPLIIAMLFPCLENLIMEEHAVMYPFDTMKITFIMVFVILDFINIILIQCKDKKIKFSVSLCVLLTLFCSVLLYRKDNLYVWKVNEGKKLDKKIANLLYQTTTDGGGAICYLRFCKRV